MYGSILYIINARLNNSFALNDDKLYIINRNFPMNVFKVIDLEKIKGVTFDEKKPNTFGLALVFTPSFIDLETEGKMERYYCVHLEQDAYDENLVEKTIDMFAHALKRRGVSVDYRLDY